MKVRREEGGWEERVVEMHLEKLSLSLFHTHTHTHSLIPKRLRPKEPSRFSPHCPERVRCNRYPSSWSGKGVG